MVGCPSSALATGSLKPADPVNQVCDVAERHAEVGKEIRRVRTLVAGVQPPVKRPHSRSPVGTGVLASFDDLKVAVVPAVLGSTDRPFWPRGVEAGEVVIDKAIVKPVNEPRPADDMSGSKETAFESAQGLAEQLVLLQGEAR